MLFYSDGDENHFNKKVLLLASFWKLLFLQLGSGRLSNELILKFLDELNSKNNGPVLLLKTIFSVVYGNQSESTFSESGMAVFYLVWLCPHFVGVKKWSSFWFRIYYYCQNCFQRVYSLSPGCLWQRSVCAHRNGFFSGLRPRETENIPKWYTDGLPRWPQRTDFSHWLWRKPDSEQIIRYWQNVCIISKIQLVVYF